MDASVINFPLITAEPIITETSVQGKVPNTIADVINLTETYGDDKVLAEFEITVDSKKSKLNRIEEIMNITDVQAKPETDLLSCYVDVYSKTNPYDVNWDYGKDYDKLVNSCDFDKIFDADFYAETYPYLAIMYHNDTELLKKHFMTVGIHEGRTGKKGFSYAEIVSILKKFFTKKKNAKLIKSLPA